MVQAKRSLSQNFLVDPNIRRKLIDELDPDPGDVVLEVGPGHGELSLLLAGRVASLLLVEKDDRLASELERTFSDQGGVELVHADALNCDLSALVCGREPLRVISNLPYAITSPLLFRFLELQPVPRRMVVLVQVEVADRITAAPGSRTYGALSVGVQAVAFARIAFRVGRRAFRPTPGVDSAAVVIDPVSDPPGVTEIRALRRLTRAAFSMRRKQLQKVLRASSEYGLTASAADSLLRDLGLEPTVRPEALDAAMFLALAARLEKAVGPGDP